MNNIEQVPTLTNLPDVRTALQGRSVRPVLVGSDGRNGLLPYVNNQNGAATPLIGTPSTTSCFTRRQVFCPLGATFPQPVFSNVGLAAPTNGEVQPTGNTSPVTVTFAVEDSNGNIYPGTFSGHRPCVLDGAGPFIGDPTPIVVLPGGTFWERVMLTYTAGSNFNVEYDLSATTYSTPTPSTTDPATAAFGTAGQSAIGGFRATLWVGQQVTPGLAVGLVGDSILGLVPSYAQPNVIGVVPTVDLHAGATSFDTNDSVNGLFRTRLYPYLTHIYIEHGINNFRGQGGLTAQNLIDKCTKQILKAGAFGVKSVLQTITPYGTGANAGQFADNPGSQLKQSNDAARCAYNDWIRGTPLAVLNANYSITLSAATQTPAQLGVTKYVEVSDLFETNITGVLTRNGGFWRVPSAPLVTGTAGVGSTSTSITGTFIASQLSSMLIKMTSGASGGQYWTIGNNSASSLPVGFSTAVASGDTYSIFATYTGDGTHPSPTGSQLIISSGVFNLAIFN